MPQPEARVFIEVDTRELASGIAARLAAPPNVSLAVACLPVGDYLLGSGVAVERKTAADFIASMIDRRLFRQAEALCEAYSRPLVLLEGDPLKVERAVQPNAVRGALAWLALGYGLAVLPTTGPDESAALLYVLARQAQGLARVPDERAKPKAAGLAMRQEALVASLPGIGPELARRLLRAFGSIAALVAADAAMLQRVPGIGGRRAAELVRVLRTPYAVDPTRELS